MERVLSTSTPIARKKYTCNACEWIDNVVMGNLYDYEFSSTELREIVKARRNSWCIVPGQRYLKVVGVYNGRLEVFRAIPAINSICHKHDIYEYE